MGRPVRPIRIVGDLAYVPLTKGYEAVIDVADVPLVEGRAWTSCVAKRADGSIRTVYAVATESIGRTKKRHLKMHRIIAATPDGLETDHRDGNGLNNRRINLRNATRAQNQHNRTVLSSSTSGYKGVRRDKRSGRWRADITANGKEYFLGHFQEMDDAVAAVADARARMHGEFGRIA